MRNLNLFLKELFILEELLMQQLYNQYQELVHNYQYMTAIRSKQTSALNEQHDKENHIQLCQVHFPKGNSNLTKNVNKDENFFFSFLDMQMKNITLTLEKRTYSLPIALYNFSELLREYSFAPNLVSEFLST